MAGFYVQLDENLPDRPEVQQIVDATGREVDVVVYRLFLFWRWCQRDGKDHAQNLGIIPGVGIEALSRVCGGDAAFWNAVVKSGWLMFDAAGIVVPGWDERFSKSARRRADDAERKRDKRARQRESRSPPTGEPPRNTEQLESVFAELTAEDLGKPTVMCNWVAMASVQFRPVVKDDQWHREHCLAAGIMALNEDGIRDPVRWFGWLVGRHFWTKIESRYLEDAKLRLRSVRAIEDRIAEAKQVQFKSIDQPKRLTHAQQEDLKSELLRRFPPKVG